MIRTDSGSPGADDADQKPPVPKDALPFALKGQLTPLRLLVTTGVAILLCEVFVVLLLDRLMVRSLLERTVLSAFFLAVLALPMLYTALFRPMISHIAGRQQLEDTLRELAIVDELTGLFNRRGLKALGDQRLKIAKRLKKSISLLFVDVDGLKAINDRLGHAEGDRALVETAEILKEVFRESDVVARFGGDEFVVLAMETGDLAGDMLAERLKAKMEARNPETGREYELTLSVGVVRGEAKKLASVDELIVAADAAMYEGRRARRMKRP